MRSLKVIEIYDNELISCKNIQRIRTEFPTLNIIGTIHRDCFNEGNVMYFFLLLIEINILQYVWEERSVKYSLNQLFIDIARGYSTLSDHMIIG